MAGKEQILQRLRAELGALKLPALMRRAKEYGVGDEELEDADDKHSVIELILPRAANMVDKPAGKGGELAPICSFDCSFDFASDGAAEDQSAHDPRRGLLEITADGVLAECLARISLRAVPIVRAVCKRLRDVAVDSYFPGVFERTFAERTRQAVVFHKICGKAAVWPARALPLVLKAQGVHIDRQDAKGNSLLMIACEYGRLDVVNVLIAAQADINLPDKWGATALLAASDGRQMTSGHADIVDVLIKAKADVNVADSGGTPVWWAAQGGHCDVVEMLIAANADVNLACNGGSPIWWANYNGHSDVVDVLIAAGAPASDMVVTYADAGFK